jgi:hypothetical protein
LTNNIQIKRKIEMKQRYRPKTKGEALDELCDIMTPDFIVHLKSALNAADDVGLMEPDDVGKLGKVLSLCNLAKVGSYGISGYGKGRLES